MRRGRSRWGPQGWSSESRHWTVASHWGDISEYIVSVYILRCGSFCFLLILYIPFGLRSWGFHRLMIECTTLECMLAFNVLRWSSIHRNLSLHIDSGHISSHSCRGCLLSVLCSAISPTFLVWSTYGVWFWDDFDTKKSILTPASWSQRQRWPPTLVLDASYESPHSHICI